MGMDVVMKESLEKREREAKLHGNGRGNERELGKEVESCMGMDRGMKESLEREAKLHGNEIITCEQALAGGGTKSSPPTEE